MGGPSQRVVPLKPSSAERAEALGAIKLKLGKIFEYTLDISTTTGYNWSQKDSTTWEDKKTYTVSQDVPGGEKVQIQAAVGYCGQNMVETKMFRVISTRTKKVLEIRNVF